MSVVTFSCVQCTLFLSHLPFPTLIPLTQHNFHPSPGFDNTAKFLLCSSFLWVFFMLLLWNLAHCWLHNLSSCGVKWQPYCSNKLGIVGLEMNKACSLRLLELMNSLVLRQVLPLTSWMNWTHLLTSRNLFLHRNLRGLKQYFPGDTIVILYDNFTPPVLSKRVRGLRATFHDPCLTRTL